MGGGGGFIQESYVCDTFSLPKQHTITLMVETCSM